MKTKIKAKPKDKRKAFQTILSSVKKMEVLAEISSIDGSLWRLCLHPFEYRRDMNPDIEDLISRSNGNPFFNPAFLAASRDRITRNKIYQLVVWEISGDQLQARLALPIQQIPNSFYMPRYFQSLTHPYAPFGDPLVGQSEIDSTIGRFATLLKAAFSSGLPPLLLDHVSENSAFFSSDISKFDEIAHQTIPLGSRASINHSTIQDGTPLLSNKRRRELNRLLKKLGEIGDVTFEKVTDPIDVILRFEEFLLLETRTWKGKHGTSIHTIKRDAAFARQSVSDLAKEGKCEIFSLRLDNEVIASTILFKSSGIYFPWKTAFETHYSKFSPGTQLMLRLSEDITQRKDFKYADSLAKFGNSWMSGIWPDETSFSKVILAKNKDEASLISKRLKLKNSVREFFKRLVHH